MKSLPFVDLEAQYVRLRANINQRIQAVLDHGQYILGPEVAELESRLAEFTGARHAIAVSSGTDALLVPLMALGVGPGDAVFVPSFTFTATAEVPLLLGASPVFVDVEEDTFNLDPRHLQVQIERVAAAGRLRPRAIIGVDLFGLPADWDTLEEIANNQDLFLIDDAAQSLGAAIGDRRIGTRAAVTATSFFPAKPLGGYGDGGALFTDDDDLAAVYRSIRAHGQGEDRYEIVRIGINGRLDSLQAAVLLAKLEVFEDELASRQRLAEHYQRRLGVALTTPSQPQDRRCSWAQFTVQVPGRDQVRAELAAAGIPTAVYYPKPMHLQTAYAAFGDGPGSCPVSEALAGRVLSLPMHPYLSVEDADRVADALLAAIGAHAEAERG